MIIKDKTQVDLQFGEGDIGVNSGCSINKKGDKVGVLAFSNQSKREIGYDGDIKVGQACSINNFPVIMTFTKKESVGVIIKALVDVMNNME